MSRSSSNYLDVSLENDVEWSFEKETSLNLDILVFFFNFFCCDFFFSRRLTNLNDFNICVS